MFSLKFLSLLLALTPVSLASPDCKISPASPSWPSDYEWGALNRSIGGVLIKTAPVASSCYPGNPFNSPENCTDIQDKWSYAAFHAALPESVDFPIWTNNSCLPDGVTGYTEQRGCSIGGLPQYIVNATTENHISRAMKWASQRNIRIVVKGTGHDLSGRSTGAFALSIWTHNFKHIKRNRAWQVPGRNETVDVLLCGSGNNWGSVYTAAHRFNRSAVGGEDSTVGLGGLIQNGGHGYLSSHYGLASDQVYQATVITTSGQLLVANSVQNEDLFWAIRGGGGGQYGVVTEFVLKTHPVPENVVKGSLSFYAADKSNISEVTSWNALSEVVSLIPDYMDGGLLGNVTAYTKQSAMALGVSEAGDGVAAVIGFIGYNMTTGHMNTILDELASRVNNIGSGGYLNISTERASTQDYWSFVKPDASLSHSSGAVSLMTSRLMGRSELSDIPQEKLTTYLKEALASENPEAGTMLLFGLQGGRGTASVPKHMRGSVLPAWRSAYAHVFTLGASINATGDPSESLKSGADYYEAVKEPIWRKMGPGYWILHERG